MDKLKDVHEIPKKQWPEGPWHKEPDRLEWHYNNTPCLIVRGPVGALCGYAGVYPNHPWYGAEYGDCVKGCKQIPQKPLKFDLVKQPVPDRFQEWHLKRKNFTCHEKYQSGHTPESIINVHGGLTYSAECHGKICHKAEPGEPDRVWWFGFDCAHAGDLSPSMEAFKQQMLREASKAGNKEDIALWGRGIFFGETYRNFTYVKAEVERLADQLRKQI